jgi:T3SS negative regulator,GrlR
MTIDGLWIVQYHGPQGDGGGVVVLVRGQVLGGDSGFTYDGTYEVKNDAFKAKVSVKNFDPAIPNVLGVPTPYELLIEGRLQGDSINGTGALAIAPDSKIVVRLKKTAEIK